MTRTQALPVAVICLLTGARGADPPSLKEGYWTTHTVSIDRPGDKKTEGTTSICRSHAYDEHANEIAKKAMARCKIVKETKSGATTTTEQECTVGGSVLHTTRTLTNLSDTAWHSEQHGTYTPPLYGVSETTMTMDQKYVGACPAEAQPGDIFGADGKKMSSWKH